MAVYSQLPLHQLAGTLGDDNQGPALFHKVVVPITVFSGEESELTCNQSGSRKRHRDEHQPSMPPSGIAICQQQKLMKQQLLMPNQRQLLVHEQAAAASNQPIDRSSLFQSTMTSTSGRPLLRATTTAAETSPVSPSYNHTNNSTGVGGSSSSSLISMLHYHSLEVDTLVRLQAEKLRSGLDEARKRQCRAVVAAMQQQAQKRVEEKQAELDAAAQRNAELEERLRQAAANSQAWFDVARNSEALVAGLRDSLEQALLRKLSDVKNGGRNGNPAAGLDLPGAGLEEEGYGDTDEEAASAAFTCSVHCAEASSSVAVAARNKRFKFNGGCFFPCKSCGEADASILLLPCRHLCLCPSCEPTVDRCPMCHGQKNESFQINLP